MQVILDSSFALGSVPIWGWKKGVFRDWTTNIPMKFLRNRPFFREFAPENPAKFDFFSATYQKPWFNEQNNGCARAL